MNKTTEELLDEFRAKDRKYRRALVVFMFAVLMVLAVVIGVQLWTNAKIDRQLALQGELLRQQNKLLTAQKENTEATNANTNAQLAKISKQIDCIAQFFATANRQDAVITDLKQCRIILADGTITDGTSFTTEGNSSPGPSSQPDRVPSNGQQSGGGGSGGGGGGTDQPADPVEVLGVPVCLPLTNVCVRQ